MIGYGNKFGLNGLYRLFEPHFHERCEFSDHCNKRIKHIRIFKLYLPHGLSELFWVENMPVMGFVGDFCGKSFGARLKYFENLHNLMNLVVKSDLRSGRCRKKYFLFSNRFSIYEISLLLLIIFMSIFSVSYF